MSGFISQVSAGMPNVNRVKPLQPSDLCFGIKINAFKLSGSFHSTLSCSTSVISHIREMFKMVPWHCRMWLQTYLGLQVYYRLFKSQPQPPSFFIQSDELLHNAISQHHYTGSCLHPFGLPCLWFRRRTINGNGQVSDRNETWITTETSSCIHFKKSTTLPR